MVEGGLEVVAEEEVAVVELEAVVVIEVEVDDDDVVVVLPPNGLWLTPDFVVVRTDFVYPGCTAQPNPIDPDA